jgi:hypothetical protein
MIIIRKEQILYKLFSMTDNKKAIFSLQMLHLRIRFCEYTCYTNFTIINFKNN